ncbi:MBL fold metallo-hydrolase [Nocardioides dubius]|uniref:MBL fold metallo-hydrolase n=1 Tax=Nocardioides dubius TaxID=317019 RepID=A0ABP4EPC5_9ACTN
MELAFVEVGDRVWVCRQEWFDLNLSVVAGTASVVVIDTGASEHNGEALRDAVARLTPLPIRAVVNTHEHFDHTLGNAAFGEVPIVAHEVAAANTVAAAQRWIAESPHEPRIEEVRASRVLAASETFASVTVLDVGERQIELIHPGRGHTGGDIVALVPDASVLIAGDLIEESAPPAYGADSYPLEWPASLDVVTSLLPAGAVVVPGHGAVVDADFVNEQRDQIAAVAETIRSLAADGVRRDAALETGAWPFPREALRHAVARGWSQLPRGSLRLPMA